MIKISVTGAREEEAKTERFQVMMSSSSMCARANPRAS
jgi:hypothetical protein